MNKQRSYRDAQLATLIAEELELVLLASSDLRLSSLSVLAVEPTGSPGGYCAYVALEGEERFFDWGDLQAALEGAAIYLRSEVVRGLNLRRAPQLTVRLVPE